MAQRSALPIDQLFPEIVHSLQLNSNLVVEAPPGAGKTTRVPPLVLDLVKGEVVVLEPRRIAARTAAVRVATELGERIGETVGYQVRFEEVTGRGTRLRYVTEGVFIRRMVSDPDLKGVDAVILDEFHERNLDGDFALALLKRLQQRRRELILIVMSATLNGGPVARYLGDCPVLQSAGRMFEVAITHLPYSADALANQVRDAVQLLIREGNQGHILTFLPGAAEIRHAMKACEDLARAHNLLMLPLYGGLSAAEQDRALAPTKQLKLIMATNVAETSVTMEGVSAVIDSGLARFASSSPWTGVPTLHLGRISRASAKQRAGRAGRTGPGRVIRLYAEEDYARRSEHDVPEILTTELSDLCLSIRAMGQGGVQDFEWLDAPPQTAVAAAETLLDRLGAVGDMAARLARYPLAPRLARIVEESVRRGVGEQGCRVAALLGAGVRVEANDLLEALDAPLQDFQFQQQWKQLRRIALPAGYSSQVNDEEVLLSILTGFPDRIARRRAGKHLFLSNGVTAEAQGKLPVYEFMVVVDVEDRKDRSLPLVRTMARIEPEWLVDLFPDRIEERTNMEWNQQAERVEEVSALLYDQLVVEESRRTARGRDASTLLHEKAMELGIESFVERESFERFLARVEFAGLELPRVSEIFIHLCEGLSSFAELRKAGQQLVAILEQMMDVRTLRERAPENIRLAGGRQVKVQYERGREPWVASRLQDFFGMNETPRIGRNRTPIVIHLLAPNYRAVQTTTDLRGFWERLYPELRRSLMRRYPKHSWPERP